MDFSSVGGKAVSVHDGKIDFSSIGGKPVPAAAPVSAVPSLFHRALNYAAQEGPPIIGGMLGGAMGAPAGPPGVIGGATLGGAAGRGLQRDWEYLSGQRDPASDTAMGNAVDMSKSGLAQGAGAGAGLATTAAMEAAAPGAAKLGGQVIRAFTGTPEKYGAAALGNAEKMAGAASKEATGKAYAAFEAKHGLTGLQGVMEKNWEQVEPKALNDMVLANAKSISGKQIPGNQSLYVASQAARKLRDMAATGDPDAIRYMNGTLIGKAKDLIDSTLEKSIPEYGPLRSGAFWSKTKQALSSILPQNKNLSPNVLRTTAALSAAGYEAEHGSPGKALIPLAMISPAAAGLAIRGGAAAAPAIGAIAPIASRAAMQSAADSSTPNNTGQSQVAQSVVKSPALISMILRSNTLNPAKSGTWGKELEGIGLPSSMVSKSGKNSITQLAEILHREGAIPENDEGEAVQYLKSIAGKVK